MLEQTFLAPGGVQALHDGVANAVVKVGEHLANVVGWDAAHVVVHGWQHRDWLFCHVDARKNLGGLGDAWKPLGQDLWRQVRELKEDVVLVRAGAPSFVNFNGGGPRDDVT